MKKLLYVFIFLFIGNIGAMRRRSSSVTLASRLTNSGRPRSNSITVPRRSVSDGVTKKISSPKRKRRLSFLDKKNNKKESLLIKKIRRAISKNTITEEEIEALEFLIDVYKKQKQNIKNKKLEEVDNFTKEIIMGDPTQMLYDEVMKANREEKESKKLSDETYEKICLFLAMGAQPNKLCKNGKSASKINFSHKLKKSFDIWDPDQTKSSQERWTEEKQKIVDKGVNFFDIPRLK